jgi:hypothetical protein
MWEKPGKSFRAAAPVQRQVRRSPYALLVRLALPRHNCFDHDCWVSIDK